MEWIFDLFSEHLLAPKVASLSVLILENPTTPRRTRKKYFDALLAVGPPQHLAICPSLVAATGSFFQQTSGIVLDVGANEARAIAVIEGFGLDHTLCVSQIENAASLVLTCVERCPLDARKILAENLYPCGGGSANAEQFDECLLEELKGLAPQMHFVIGGASRFQRDHIPWIGGSVMAAVADLEGRFDGIPLGDLDGPPDIFSLQAVEGHCGERRPLVTGIRLLNLFSGERETKSKRSISAKMPATTVRTRRMTTRSTAAKARA